MYLPTLAIVVYILLYLKKAIKLVENSNSMQLYSVVILTCKIKKIISNIKILQVITYYIIFIRYLIQARCKLCVMHHLYVCATVTLQLF